ncbi:MAG: hypothetical protein LBD59_00060, partial [Prevotellaceae bacterium]|jgi:hypothetical protein|nr:hypothetical protein [Prevotellaceae bacterium]
VSVRKLEKNDISAKSRRDDTLLTAGFSLRQRPRHGCWDKVLPCPLYPCRLCLHLHLCWQAQPTKIYRTRHSLVRTTGLHIKSTNSTFRPYGTAVTRLGLRFLPTFRPYWTAVACIRVFGQTLNIYFCARKQNMLK